MEIETDDVVDLGGSVVRELHTTTPEDDDDPRLAVPCPWCSVGVSQPCRDRQFNDREPHSGRGEPPRRWE